MHSPKPATCDGQVIDPTNMSLAVLALAAGNESLSGGASTAAHRVGALVNDSTSRNRDQSVIVARCSACKLWKTTPYQVRNSVLDSLIRSHLSAEEAFEACEHLVGIDHAKGDHEALATLRHHQRSSSLKTITMRPQTLKRPSSPSEQLSLKKVAAFQADASALESTDGIRFRHDDNRDFYVAMRSSALFIPQLSSPSDQDSSLHSTWPDLKKKSAKLTKEEKERDRSVKKDNILKSLASQHLTEKEILHDVGDSRYTREVLRKLLAEAKIYRVGKGGAGDPFRYVAAEFYDGADKLPEGFVTDIGLELRLLRVATKIKDLVCESREGMTEKEIRVVVGDNVGTGKALRSLISQGHLKRMGRGGSGDPFVYEVVSGFEQVPVYTCEQGPQVQHVDLSEK